MQVTEIEEEGQPAGSPYAPNRAQRRLATKAARGAITLRAYSVSQFCLAYGLGRSTYYRLRAQGLAPREIACGKRILISVQAAEEWEQRMERERPSAD
jgi:predicted DNA-binding transcriptional regulator AlpA